MQEKPGQTLQATALVHEAYLRLVGPEASLRWDNRGHFFAAAAEAMRRILVDEARRKWAIKRGGLLDRRGLEAAQLAAPVPGVDLLELDEALDRLAARDPEAAELVKLRYFAGMTVPEAAAALGLSERTAARIWTYARAFLREEIGDRRRMRFGCDLPEISGRLSRSNPHWSARRLSRIHSDGPETP